MLKRFRLFFSANLVAVLFVSTFIFSDFVPVKGCPAPVPKTLLALYLESDLIFTADFTDQKDGKILLDEKDFVRLEIIRNLKVSSVLKGKPPRNFSYADSEYRDKIAAESNADEDNSEIKFYRYGYTGSSRLKVGERYLFFFKKNSKSNEYLLTDWISGFKKLSDADLFVHEKRIRELKHIIKTKENQLDEITKWLIRLIEEPATRWDGVYDLTASFEALEYAAEQENEDDSKKPEDRKAFVIDEDFNGSLPEIARNLSDSQKQYISSLAFSSIQQEMSEGSFGDFYYNLSNLVRRWDKSRLAIYAFGFLQTADKSDAVKINAMMEYVSSVLEDEKLSEIVSDYPVEELSEQTEEIAREETKTDNESEEIDENVVESVTAPDRIVSAETSTKSEQKTEKLTVIQKREKSLQDFINRYEYLLARGFPVEAEAEDEVAEN